MAGSGPYALCWQYALSETAVRIGTLTLAGPAPRDVRTRIGEKLTLVLTGLGLAVGNRLLLAENGTQRCNASRAVSYDGWPSFPFDSSDSNASVYSLGTALTGDTANVSLCWAHSNSSRYQSGFYDRGEGG